MTPAERFEAHPLRAFIDANRVDFDTLPACQRQFLSGYFRPVRKPRPAPTEERRLMTEKDVEALEEKARLARSILSKIKSLEGVLRTVNEGDASQLAAALYGQVADPSVINDYRPLPAPDVREALRSLVNDRIYELRKHLEKM